MNTDNAKMLIKEIETFLSENSDIDEFEVLATDFSGHFFGKRYPIAKLKSFAKHGLCFPLSCFVLSNLGEPLDNMHYGIDDGDPDADFELIANSLSRIEWGSKPRAQVLATTTTDNNLAFFEPRRVLQKVLDAYKNNGFFPVVAFELEFYLFCDERNESDLIQIVRNPKTGRLDTATVLSNRRVSDFEWVIDEIIDACNNLKISTGAISSELGPGQFEINFNHHQDVLRAADEACLFKNLVVEVAKRHSMQASFMAKPLLDQAGNGLHMHISILDKNAKNIFSKGDKADPRLHNAIAGLIDLMPAAMSFWAPNINSYKRFQGGTSCAPMSKTWGNENRTVAFRIPLAKDGAWRVENRVAGADSNPYLAMAVTLGAMLNGIQNKLDPGPASENAVEGADPELPLSMNAAIELSAASPALSEILGADFVDLYCRHRTAEKAAFENFISTREYDWYL